MRLLRTSSKYLFVLACLLYAAPVIGQDQLPPPAITATFAGYEEDDLIFNVTNGEIYLIVVKGISYRGQVLYRPLEKNQLVPSLTKEPVLVKFRSNGDYVWSENHMKKFRMAYAIFGSPKRYYAEILPETEANKP